MLSTSATIGRDPTAIVVKATPAPTIASDVTVINKLPMPSFGHAVHVEEDSELLLENELKHAAQQNEAKSSRMYDDDDEAPHHMSVDASDHDDHEEEEEELQVEVDDDEEAVAEEEKMDLTRKQLSKSSNMCAKSKRLERASSHYTYKQFAHNFTRHSQQLYQHLPPSYSSLLAANSNSNNSIIYERLLLQQQQQQQHYQQQQYNAHKELEELRHKQLHFHNASKSSFFSDPHLLKSLKIASSASNAHLDWSPSFSAFGQQSKGAQALFDKANQADVSKIVKIAADDVSQVLEDFLLFLNFS